ncbi:inner membrane-spanning protein YciB [Croceicoccus naphthovorans]|uniref:Inner membrane-spanning protein YciB n=1 Tax=Croceicoccus naphthovorans TaxID=1348774 RepID=A0A0G3XJP7_9SPHN|nr:inner membrane-spanning protein YciB [Croceicoccus naphthovorans]AKM10578.1 septation protein A [Croceicoccus naphthovorans]MBB3988792.1 intracellular septation protein [Croceicoccus naphthovorans]
MADEIGTQVAKKKSGWLNIAIDYGPLLVFFAVYKWFGPEQDGDAVGEVLAIVKGTGAFIVAAIVAVIVSKLKLGHVTPMLMLSTALIVFFGGLTILFQDPVFVQIKPTIIYAVFAAALLIGYWRGKALLKYLLDAAFEGLSDKGWMKLSRNWGVYFIFLGVLNEVLRASLSFEDWLVAKLWVFLPLSFLFTFTQLPMMMREGLGKEEEDEAVTEHPPA